MNEKQKTTMSIGEKLREERMAQGLSVRALEDQRRRGLRRWSALMGARERGHWAQ